MEKTILHDSNIINKLRRMLSNLVTFRNQPVIICGAVTVLVIGLQKLQVLETMELKIYDQMIQLLPDQDPDQRLLIVRITEEDLQKWNWPLSGEILDRLFDKLQEYQPRAIGLDIFRDLPVQPGHEKLLERLQQSDVIISICKHADSNSAGIASPQGVEPSQVGFSDLVEDTDGFIRRNLISVNVNKSDKCQTPYSLSWQLATKYLAVGGILPQLTTKQELKLRDVVFKPLETHSGGYENADTQGYQILLNYRSHRQIAPQVTLTDILTGKIQPNLVKDRIVFIGSTAPSLKDIFNTPFNSGKADDSGRMTGVEIHAQITSEILSAVLNNQPLFWFLPPWGEFLWIGTWSAIGGFLACRIRHPLGLGIGQTISLLVLFAGNLIIFTQAGWLPVIAPALSLILTANAVITYSNYASKQEEQKIRGILEKQAKDIEELRSHQTNGDDNNINYVTGQPLNNNALLKGRYQITERLGGGGFGKTYLAADTQRPRNPLCVVKQMSPARRDPEYLKIATRLFNNEASILETLGKHQQIPQLLAFFQQNQEFYLIQEYIEGHTLTKELTPGRCCSYNQVMNILNEVLQVLVFVHSYGVIHRDIKPDNLIRRKEDHKIVLIDFGGVKQIQPQQQTPDNLTIGFGTSGYAPGEQLNGMPRLNSDIYALGIIAIQALTGITPKDFRRHGNTGLIVIDHTSSRDEGTLQSWQQIANINDNDELVRILNKMVNLDFTKRYESAKDVLKDIN
ncbi:CHASE2 domain-containing serine/threonine-protein kinase [Dolichospermum circinale CS-534/05]|uniref:CHASE2 domain-containing serine/threonine-protein kinase n=1 Tax=Dolichospermum circinale TaxID=109265 RepID=UPI00232F0C37|nr:CHASE2 domain-containing serine/threonine-protein kinase [Dolichospermum circinale]MDB9490778.1 CHASE2 domain-containing serine/threonine-protein kinase [Dolichospermum circinale CS-534/05]